MTDGARQRPALRWAIAFVWLATGLLVFHPEFRAVGLKYLEPLGLGVGVMMAACLFEVGLGFWVGAFPTGRVSSALQVGLILFFSAALAIEDPLLLVHPFGVLSKNLPLLGLIAGTYLLEREGWTPRAEWVLRVGMASIWITEGIFPKILFQQPLELEVVRGSGLVPFDPAIFLVGLGVAQALSGALALLLRGPLCAMLLWVQAAALVVLPLLVSLQDPSLWVHPFGPMTKNVPILAGTLALAARSWRQPFLTARWSNLAIFTFSVPPATLEPFLPRGVELDLHRGRACLSLVALDFHDTRVGGFAWPGFTRFPDVNLRFYVREGDRRGVVFVRELVPSRIVAAVARLVYGEPFRRVPLRTRLAESAEGVEVERTFHYKGKTQKIAVNAFGPASVPGPESTAQFFKERYWGFRRGWFGRTHRFRVTHPLWEVRPVGWVDLDLDWEAVYGPEWAFMEKEQAVSVLLALGSEVSVYLGPGEVASATLNG